MNISTSMLAAVVLAALVLGGCQPPPESDETEVGSTEIAAGASSAGATTQTDAPQPANPACAVLAHRDWRATLNVMPGSRSTLTVEGKIDLPRPGYRVSLVRDPAEDPMIAEPHLSLSLAEPTDSGAQVVTTHPVYYFAPAPGRYTTVHVMCGGQALTNIAITTVQ